MTASSQDASRRYSRGSLQPPLPVQLQLIDQTHAYRACSRAVASPACLAAARSAGGSSSLVQLESGSSAVVLQSQARTPVKRRQPARPRGAQQHRRRSWAWL